MKNKIIANSLCFTIVLKIYRLISKYFKHSIVYRSFCSFTYLLQDYSQHSKISRCLFKKSKYQKISLYNICMNKFEKTITNLIKILNDIYKKSLINSFLFKFFCKDQKNIKKNPQIYIFLTLLSSIVSFNILNLFFDKLYLNQIIISTLFIISITIFYLNSSTIIKNSNFINILIKLLNSGIEE